MVWQFGIAMSRRRTSSTSRTDAAGITELAMSSPLRNRGMMPSASGRCRPHSGAVEAEQDVLTQAETGLKILFIAQTRTPVSPYNGLTRLCGIQSVNSKRRDVFRELCTG